MKAEPTIESVASSIRTDPDALLSDRVLDFACSLDDVTFERLRKRLSDGYVSREDLFAFVRAVKARRKERKARRGGEAAPDDRPTIVITTDEAAVNEQAARALARIPGLYSRVGELVRIVASKRRKPGEAHPYTVTEIRVVTEALLREYFTRAAKWIEPKEDPNGGTIPLPAHPPDWSVKAVKAWNDWPDVAPLYHLAESPVMLPSGRVIQDVGYDEHTGIMCNTSIQVDVPDRLTREDAAAAAAELTQLVAQVPFEDDAHRSAWVAALLSPIARWAFKGQCPLFLFDANKYGAGKGFLVNIISGIVLGRPCDYTTQTDDEDAERKMITSKVLSGAPIVWIDEVDKPFGSGPLQGLLTSGVWSERLLGGNEAPTFPVYIVWFAAGNNVQLKTGDIARRTCFVRIVTDLDNPAERTGFAIDDMDAHVEKNRERLFRAALVMLRAWMTSGLTASSLSGWGGKWGSFDDWDRVVRGAIVYAGLADPIGAKATRAAPSVKEGVGDLVMGLEEVLAAIGRNGEATSAAIHAALADNDAKRKEAREAFGTGISPPAQTFATLRKGIACLMPQLKGNTPTTQQLGNLLGKNQAQAVSSTNGRKWIKYRHADGGLWRVDIITVQSTPPATEDDAYEREERAAMQGSTT